MSKSVVKDGEVNRQSNVQKMHKAEIIIQDVRAYEDMMNLLDSLEKIALAAKEHEQGKGIAADDAFCTLSKRIAGKFPD